MDRPDEQTNGSAEMDHAWLTDRLHAVGADDTEADTPAVAEGPAEVDGPAEVEGPAEVGGPADTSPSADTEATEDGQAEAALAAEPAESSVAAPTPVGLGALPDPAALIFDLDGTLVDTVETRIEAWLETFQRVGIPADRKHVAGLIGADGKRLAQEVAAIAGRTLNEDKAEAIDRHAGERYDALNTDPRPLPGATELLTALEQSDLPWAIATSSRAGQIQRSVDALGLPEPPRIIDGSHVKHAKPAPDLLLLAAERLSVPALGCWYVGDATWDMRAARAAGMLGIGVPTGAVTATELERATAPATVASLQELTEELTRRGVISGS